MIILGILLMVSIIPFAFLFKGGFCLTCLGGVFLFLIGLAVLVNGIATLVRNTKKDDSGVDIDEDKMNPESLIEPLFLIKDATVRIFRNRRRSSAMLSGIVLSSMVIGSVFIFTQAMQEDFYNDFVRAIPFEASFTYK